MQHERPRTIGSIEGTNVTGIAAVQNLPNVPRCPVPLVPGDSTLSFAPSSQGQAMPEAVAQYGAQLALTANPPNVSTPLARSGLVGLGHGAPVDATPIAAAALSAAAASELPLHEPQSQFDALPDEHQVVVPRLVMPRFAFPNPIGHAPSTATGSHALPIQPIVDVAPRHDPPDAHVLVRFNRRLIHCRQHMHVTSPPFHRRLMR